MAAPLVRQIKIREGDAVKLMARVVGPRNTALTRSQVSAITWAAYDLKSNTSRAAIDSGTLTVNSVIYDTLQTTADDAAWEEDETGYNFAYQFPADLFSRSGGGSGRFRLEIRGVPAAGEKFWIGVWDVTVVETLTDVST